MNVRQIISLLALTHLLSAQSCNPTLSVNSTSLQCKFKFQVSGGSCAASKFASCSVKYCSDSVNQGSCNSYNSFEDTSFTNCMNFCCGGSATSTDAYTSALSCASTGGLKSPSNSYDINKILMIILITFAILVLLATLAFCIYRRFSNYNHVRIMNNISNPEAVSKKVRLKQAENDEASVQNIIASKQWKEADINEEELPHCSICLSERPNLKLQCGHHFHPVCFKMWLKKKFQCGVCRGNRLSTFQLICEHCFKRKTKIQLADFTKLQKRYNKMVCVNCYPQ